MLALDGWRTWQARFVTIDAAKVETSNLARSLAVHVHDAVHEADMALVDLRARAESDGEWTARLHDIERIMAIDAGHATIGLFLSDRAGNWLAHAIETPSDALDPDDRRPFDYHRNHTSRDLHLGDPVRTVAGGPPVLTLSRRIDGPDGSFAGIVLATMSITALDRIFASYDTGRHGVIALFSATGSLITRLPAVRWPTARDTPGGDRFPSLQGQSAPASFTYKSVFDGTIRLGSTRSVDEYPLNLLVADGLDEVLENWRGTRRSTPASARPSPPSWLSSVPDLPA